VVGPQRAQVVTHARAPRRIVASLHDREQRERGQHVGAFVRELQVGEAVGDRELESVRAAEPGLRAHDGVAIAATAMVAMEK